MISQEIIDVSTGESRKTQYEYDLWGNVISKILPDGSKITNEYDNLGRLVVERDPTGGETRYEYDILGRVKRKINPDGTWEEYEYDAVGRIISVSTPSGSIHYKYDILGNLVEKITPGGIRETYEYDALGRVTKIFSGGVIRTLKYDSEGNIIEVQINGLVTRNFYDAQGNLTATIDPKGLITRFEYDALSNITKIIEPDGSITQMFYDFAGRLTAVLNPAGQIHRIEYDEFGRVIREIDFAGVETVIFYNGFGNVIRKIQGGIEIKFQYDKVGRITKKIYPDGTVIEFAYDNAGRIIEIAGKGSKIKFHYNRGGKMVAREFLIPGIPPIKVEYKYDNTGRRTSVKDIGGETIYEWDSDGRLKVVSSGKKRMEIEYDEFGRRKKIKFPNGVVETYKYTEEGRLKEKTISGSDFVWFERLSYDRRGNITEIERPDGKIIYEYDTKGQLVRAVYDVEWDKGEEGKNGKGKGKKEEKRLNFAFEYVYDKVGNILLMRLLSDKEELFDPRYPRPKDKEPFIKHPVEISYSYDGQKLISYDVIRLKNREILWRVLLSYNGMGNLTNKRVIKEDGKFDTIYRYDAEGRLSYVLYPDFSEEYVFLEEFLLKIRQEDGNELNFIYDDTGLLENVLLELNQDGKVLRRYVLGSEIDKRFWMEVFDDNENREIKTIYYHTDHSGSVVLLSDEKGRKSGKYEYSPYGMILVAFGPQAKKNFYTFAGTRYLVNLGMYWMRMRMYDPRIRRFIQVDPFGRKSFDEDFTSLISEEFKFGMRKEGCGSCCGGGKNHITATNSASKYEPYYNYYLYAGGNPIRFSDPLGLFKIENCSPKDEELLRGIISNELKTIRDSGCVKKNRCKWYYLYNIYNMLTEAINNPNKPKLECKSLPEDVAGEWKLGRGIAININHSSFKNVKNTDGKDTCSRWYVALTLLHEVVHWAWRGEDRAYSCECRCWEKNAGSCKWIGESLGCSTCKTPKGGYNTCLDCC